jgi:RNA polymerase sigma factor (sigma-70 family)
LFGYLGLRNQSAEIVSDFSPAGCLISEMPNTLGSTDTSDAQLLRDYAHGVESAFAQIVTRHADFVYSAALRQCGSPETAREIAQAVFSDLARKARSVARPLTSDASLAGWLYHATRYAALAALRSERRRVAREQLLMQQHDPTPSPECDWSLVAPVLDEAMEELNEGDREAVLLRFFKNLDFAAVGRALGVSDDAAQKRVSRAVERLRELLAKRGISASASGLVVVISTNAVQIAPVGLVATLTSTSLSATIAATGTTFTLLKLVAMTKFQLGIITALVVAVSTMIAIQQNGPPDRSLKDGIEATLSLHSGAESNGLRSSAFSRTKRVPALAEPEPMYQGKTLGEWIEDLRSGNAKLKQTAWDTLIAIGPPAIPALKQALEDIRTVNSAAFILALIGKESLPVLLEYLTNGPLLTRREIAGAGVMQVASLLPYEDEIIPALIVCMRHEDATVRGGAINAFQSYSKRPDLVLPPLIECLTDSNANVRGSAVTVIRKFGSDAKPAVTDLVWLAKQDPDSFVRTRAAESLRFISPERADKEGL